MLWARRDERRLVHDAELEKNDPEAQKRRREQHRKQKVDTGAAGDPIGLFRELEKKNMEMMEWNAGRRRAGRS